MRTTYKETFKIQNNTETELNLYRDAQKSKCMKTQKEPPQWYVTFLHYELNFWFWHVWALLKITCKKSANTLRI